MLIAILPHVRPDGIVYRHPLCDAAYRKDPLSQVDAGFPSGHMEHSAGGDPGYRPGHAGACRYMDVCYEPEQHEYGYRDLVRSGCDLWEEAQHKRLPGIEKVHRNSVRITVDFLVRAWGLEPQRIAAREPKGYVTLVKDFQSPPYRKGRTSFQRFKRCSVVAGRTPAKS